MSTRPPAAPDGDPAAMYREVFALLRTIASRKFGVPPEDAEALVQDVFVGYLRRWAQITDARAWLVAAVCNAARGYWRVEGRTAPTPEAEIRSHADAVCARIDAALVLRRIPARCRKVLRLRFYDGCTAGDLAAHLETTAAYAKLLLHRCMAAARAVLAQARR